MAISSKEEYSYPTSSVFHLPDFSWRIFAYEFIPLVSAFTWNFDRARLPQIVKDLGKIIKLLHKSCNYLCENITKICKTENSDVTKKFFDRNQKISKKTKKIFLKLKKKKNSWIQKKYPKTSKSIWRFKKITPDNKELP